MLQGSGCYRQVITRAAVALDKVEYKAQFGPYEAENRVVVTI